MAEAPFKNQVQDHLLQLDTIPMDHRQTRAQIRVNGQTLEKESARMRSMTARITSFRSRGSSRSFSFFTRARTFRTTSLARLSSRMMSSRICRTSLMSGEACERKSLCCLRVA